LLFRPPVFIFFAKEPPPMAPRILKLSSKNLHRSLFGLASRPSSPPFFVWLRFSAPTSISLIVLSLFRSSLVSLRIASCIPTPPLHEPWLPPKASLDTITRSSSDRSFLPSIISHTISSFLRPYPSLLQSTNVLNDGLYSSFHSDPFLTRVPPLSSGFPLPPSAKS